MFKASSGCRLKESVVDYIVTKQVARKKIQKLFSFFFTGLGLLMFALFLSARMGIYQEVLYSKYGKHPREALFFSVSCLYVLQITSDCKAKVI